MVDSAAFHLNGSEIAIIGLSGHFPGAKNIEEFWHNLQAGVESITFFTDEELIASGIDKAIVNQPNYVKARGVLADAELFDASFFGFTPKEAEITDPQHRLFLECAWSALENSGYNPENYFGAIGVYAGSGLSGYLFNVYTNENIRNSVDGHQITIGGDKDYLSTRVSYKLNLQGPSYTIQTACSTSLVAVHLACQNLLNGECDMALAGGVSISALRKHGYFYKEGGIGSPDGHCRAFDAKAQGTVGGEGVGIVVLKRLEDAIADKDTIHAVIKGSAINNDGSQKVSFTAPSINTQAKVIRTAQAVAEVAPETITYIEAHGTGTSLGDPIEIAALTEAFRAGTDKTGFCAIGSLKTNTGHMDAAAGVAGLIKTVLALKHQKIPASLHFEQANPQIDFVNSPFYVNTQLTNWQSNGTPRRAGVSSFGIGGTNAHVILEEAPVLERGCRGAEVRGRFQLLVLSAKTSTALETATENLVQHLQQNQDLNLADVAYTLAVGRKALEHRRILVCQNLDDAITTLTSPDNPEVFTYYQKPCHRPVVFMFPGQGSQYADMGRELYESEPYFREQVDYCVELLKPHLGFDLRDVIYPNATQTQELTQTAITQPALFVIEYALAKLWMTWGVRPEAMIGHSIGEYVAATLAGVFSLEDALKLVATRGCLMQQLPEGAMLSVQMGESEIQPFLGVELALAASNAPSACVVSGSVSAIANLEQQLQQQGINCRKLHTSGAFHSPMMDAIIEPFTKLLQQISLHPPQIPFISNLSGTWISAAAATDPDYWAKHLRQTVRFSNGITELQKQSERIFLEVGPGRTLSTFVKQHQKTEVVTLTSLRHPQEQKSDVAFIFNTLGRLWLQGVKVDWSSFYSHEKPYHIPLPTYPFERQRYWVEPQQQRFKTQTTTDELWKSVVAIRKTQAQTQLLDEATYLSNKQCLDNLCVAYINLALRHLDIFKNASSKYSFEELYEQTRIIPRYRQLLYRWLDVLVEQGYLQQEQGLFSNLIPLSNDMLNTLLETARLKLADFPELVDIVEECGANLPVVLRGEIEPLELYFSAINKSTETTKTELPLDTYLKGIMQATLEQIRKLLPPNVNLRILEIGGGQGIATTALLPVLPGERTSYTFTDVGGLLLNRAKENFSAYPFVEYRFLDIEKPPTEQGYELHSFDVIIAVNVLHVTSNIGKTLDHVRSLLAPGGLLLLWEITEPQLNFDITDGLLMNPLEDTQRSRGNPFLSQKQWCEALKSHGFVEVAAVSETEVFGEEILVAQATTTDSAPTAFSAFIDQKLSEENTVLLGKKPNIADWFYIPTWKRATLPQYLPNEIKTTQSKCWLILVDECGLGEKIVKRLRLEDGEVITVKVGEKYSRQSDRSYTINPEQPQDYKFLCQELRTLGTTPTNIIHLWSVTPDHLEEFTPQQYESWGFYSLVFLTQAIAEFYQKDTLHIQVISNHLQMVTGSEQLCPEKALIIGPCKVIPLEYSNLTCSSIDVVLPLANSWQEQQLINQLLTEISSETPEQIIAYRGHHRWVQDFEAIKLDTPIQENQRLRRNGVYLITGGLGGVGLALAKYLAKTVQAKLILVGRSPFPQPNEWTQWLSTHDAENVVSQKIHKLQNLQAYGAEIIVISADVADYEQMSAVVKKANLQFGQINGVIHAAAVVGGGMIQLKTKEIAANALAPKVQGTRILNNIFQNTKLDLFVLCSSLSSFAGTSGMVDYTAENAFIDAFAHYHATQHSNFITSINWDRWNSLGMAVAVEERHKDITGEELTAGMTVEEGIEAFNRILSSNNSPQIVVSTQDLYSQLHPKKSHKSIEEQLAKLNQARTTHPRPNLNNAYVAPRNEVEITLTDIWQQLLGIDNVGIHDNFFELGGDSLFATQLVSQLGKTFQVELSYKRFFDQPTVAELAEVIVQKLAKQTNLEDLAQALADIEKLSDDEVQTILALQNLSNN
ncbi:acyltransferase domain-containing protein [Nostoc sp. CENA67]|uniref:Phenolphthiocerol/phthiocerol polyketide synthase subunit E n=1 Tax=Amazonocrinis nigriterrae CENA67 TaxID=2794033 RepID=A0A8J7L615_9NOST|nr:type I polyketide synthase [Amazonocrinis nigriterrae]MBH8561814.1 acyltransferase domain-containing protein [Amazonocrinis nigriterrae CENA67]